MHFAYFRSLILTKMTNCQICGLPEEICLCKEQKREGAKLSVYTEKRRYGKDVTIVSGLTDKKALDEIGTTLKKKCAAGGTIKDNKIEIQGNHLPKVKKILQEMGYAIA